MMSNAGHNEEAMNAVHKQQEEQLNQQIRVTALNLAVHLGAGSTAQEVSEIAKTFESFIKGNS